jgi:uncharacterized protein (DUF302 family)
MSDADRDNGLVHVPSAHSVPETAERLLALVQGRGMTVFARIDFSGDAARAGLSMPPSQLLVFGNPRAGTPLMVAAPAAAIDLPLKALAWQDAAGKVWLSYNTPEYLRQRHGLSAELVAPLAGIRALVEAAAA